MPFFFKPKVGIRPRATMLITLMPMLLAPQAGQQRRSVTIDSEALEPVVQDKLLELDFAFSPC